MRPCSVAFDDGETIPIIMCVRGSLSFCIHGNTLYAEIAQEFVEYVKSIDCKVLMLSCVSRRHGAASNPIPCTTLPLACFLTYHVQCAFPQLQVSCVVAL